MCRVGNRFSLADEDKQGRDGAKDVGKYSPRTRPEGADSGVMLTPQGARSHSPCQEVNKHHDGHDDEHLLPGQVEVAENKERDKCRRRHLGNNPH